VLMIPGKLGAAVYGFLCKVKLFGYWNVGCPPDGTGFCMSGNGLVLGYGEPPSLGEE